MHAIAEKYHSAILHIFFHCTSESSLGIFCEFIRLVYNQHFETPTAFGLDVCVGCNLFNHVLDNVSVVVFIVSWCHLDVIVAREYTIFNCG